MARRRPAVAVATAHPVTAYARAVVGGEVVAGRLVRLAAARHLRDLETLPALGYRFDAARADHAIEFFPRYLRLYDAGERTGDPFRLELWQQFVVGSLFGWLGPDGYRRFRTAYLEAGKGSGKTPLLAGIGLYGITVDDEPGAQVFCAAVVREQARILYDDAKHLAEASEALADELEIGEQQIFHRPSLSVMKPVSSEGRSLDAKRVHMALIDEVHEHRTGVVVTKLSLGVKGRRQPLIAEITNSGYDRTSVCWQHHELSRKILEGVVTNESWFAYICGLDPCEPCRAKGLDMPQEGCADCDDWRDEAVWLKANPNLDVSLPRTYLRQVVQNALQMPSEQSAVKRLNFCIWTESRERWFAADAWAACGAPVDPEALKGRPCVAGIDLSTTTDLTAVVLVFPDEEFFVEPAPEADVDAPAAEAPAPATVSGGVDVLAWGFCPEAGILQRSRTDRVPYDLWRDQGHLLATPGNMIDQQRIRRHLNELRAAGYDIQEVAADPWNFSGLARQLTDDGFTVAEVAQSTAALHEPSMLLEILVGRRTLRHGGHPVLAWCAANVVCYRDAGGRMRPSKKDSTERIDLVTALVTALKRVPALAGGGSGFRITVA